MSTWAAIYSAGGEPLTDSVLIAGDAEFDALETTASVISEAGTKCCIRWCRDSDGQVAYWGPTGAMLTPHWYARTDNI